MGAEDARLSDLSRQADPFLVFMGSDSHGPSMRGTLAKR